MNKNFFPKWITYHYRLLSPRPIKSFGTVVANHFCWAAQPKLSSFIEIDPHQITKWLTPKEYPEIRYACPGLVIDGNWDLYALDLTTEESWNNFDKAKQVSVLQRYLKGKAWRETDLFRFHYQKIIRTRSIRGFSDIKTLEVHYEKHYDSLFERIANAGLRPPSRSDPSPSWLYIHVGRSGELLFSDNGNHRLAMAIACGHRKVPVRVLARHIEWQLVRERRKRGETLPSKFAQHVDLQDIP